MKKAIIVSGYFNPIHKGHIEYFNQAKQLGDILIVIVNNDIQRALKGAKEFQLEQERMFIVSNLKSVDQVFLSIDQDRTVCKTIKLVHDQLGSDFQLSFANGGDQNNLSIPEVPICNQLGIKLIDGLGEKIQSSSWLLNKDKRWFELIERELTNKKIEVLKKDFDRPWGGFFVIEEDQVQKFSDAYFDGIQVDQLKLSGKLSPKVLLINPSSRLSWQYHRRRAEIWRVIKGPVGIIRSKNDKQGELEVFETGDIVTLKQGERHRLIGLNDWGIVAEFWQHTDPFNPSDEDDIVRLEDDYSRK